jgi:hypothetical protein
MSNLKVLQLRVNWLYVASSSYLAENADLYKFVRMELGARALRPSPRPLLPFLLMGV